MRLRAISFATAGLLAIGASAHAGNVIVATAYGVEPKNAAVVVGNGFYGDRVTVNAQPGFNGVVQKNNFVGSRDGCALTNLSGTSGLTVTNNFWGAATGPGARPPTISATSWAARRRVVPFATKPFSVKARVKP